MKRIFGSEENCMNNLFLKLRIPLAALFLLTWVIAAAAFASEGPRWKRSRHSGGGHSVAEPAAIVLLGAGLVSLGIYAKRKRDKK